MNNPTAEGVILKGVGGFYTVQTPEGQVVCRARGKFRLEKTSPLPGDRVRVSLLPDGSGWLTSIFPRRNAFVRPPVCNIDAMVMVVSEAVPVSDPYLIDRMTVIAAHRGVEVIICVNKSDLAPGLNLTDIYGRAGFHVIQSSGLTGSGLDELVGAISGKIVAFTGNSGVGKSTLLNALDPEHLRETGEVSEKLGRGRHVTRHVELFRLPCGVIAADTPGFAALDAAVGIGKEELASCFIDFRPYLNECRYSGCLHVGVRGCALEDAVRAGDVVRERYESYRRMLASAENLPVRREPKK